jgi:RsiW-degrading membrane proteinase PrsW (M82 family)
MSVDSAQNPSPASSAPALALPRRRVPRRFFIGTLLLYGIVLGTYFLALTPLHRSIPNWTTVIPTLAFAGFYVSAGLFLLILGRGHVSRWEVLKVIAATFVLTCALCLSLRAEKLLEAIDPANQTLHHLVGATAGIVRWLFSGETILTDLLEFAGMIVVEEVVKLLPVFVLIATGRLKTAHDAMLCGALAGLTFGVVEAVGYAYLEYAPQMTPITTYLTRFFVMAPLHGIWDALGGGLVFFLSGRWRSNTLRRPGVGAIVAAFACAVVFHIAHNAFQAVRGPETQIITVFALLAPLYVMSKSARRWAEAQGQPLKLPFIGDLHLLMISLSTMFLATSVTFAWALGPVPPQPPSQLKQPHPMAPPLHQSEHSL